MTLPVAKTAYSLIAVEKTCQQRKITCTHTSAAESASSKWQKSWPPQNLHDNSMNHQPVSNNKFAYTRVYICAAKFKLAAGHIQPLATLALFGCAHFKQSGRRELWVRALAWLFCMRARNSLHLMHKLANWQFSAFHHSNAHS